MAQQENNGNSHPVINTREQKHNDRMKKILESAKRRIGLKPVLPGHITSNESYGDLNGREFSETRRDAAKEFILKGLSIKQDITILSTKLSRSSPIKWVELEDPDIADAILIETAKVRNPEGRAVMYPP